MRERQPPADEEDNMLHSDFILFWQNFNSRFLVANRCPELPGGQTSNCCLWALSCKRCKGTLTAHARGVGGTSNNYSTLKLIRFQRTQKPCGIHGWFDDGKQTRTLILPFLPNFSLKRSHRMLKEKLKSYYRNWGLVYVRVKEKPGG